MDRKLWTKLIFILFILALAFYYVHPWDEKLKGGIDLVGGTSLLYEIDTAGLDDSYGAAEDVVKVLRRRVDPDNVRNLIWRTVGSTRIEILMPLPSQRNREISQNYNQAVEKLEAGNISLSTVHNVLQMPAGSQRQRASVQGTGIGRRPVRRGSQSPLPFEPCTGRRRAASPANS